MHRLAPSSEWMHVHVIELAARQDGLWQLRAAGLSKDAIFRAVAGLRQLHDGVWLTGVLPPTDRQLWRAATLTTESSVLSHAAAASSHSPRPRTDPSLPTRPLQCRSSSRGSAT